MGNFASNDNYQDFSIVIIFLFVTNMEPLDCPLNPFLIDEQEHAVTFIDSTFL